MLRSTLHDIDNTKRSYPYPKRIKFGNLLLTKTFKVKNTLACLLLVILLSDCATHSQEVETIKITYPEVRKDETVVDDYFGTKVADPYRWLEDDNSEETAKWVETQNQATFSYLEQIPYRKNIRQRLEKLYNYERYSTPFSEGKYLFYFKNDGKQNQAVLYYQEGIDGIPKVLLDPNTLSEDGTVAVGTTKISDDGKYLAYSISRSGSDWNEIYVREIETGKDLKDKIEWVKFSGINWLNDGFYYSRYDAPDDDHAYSDKNEFHKVYYHKLGTSQAEDKLVHHDEKEPQRTFNVGVTETDKALILYESKSTSGNAIYFKDANKPETKFQLIAPGFDHDYWVIDYINGYLMVLTNDGAPNQRLVLIDPENPQKENWYDLIHEGKSVLESVSLCGGKIIAKYLKDASSLLAVYSLEEGNLEKKIELPGVGTVGDINGKIEDKTAFYSFKSFTNPGTIYKYDINTNTSEVFKKSDVNFSIDEYETTQVFYTSKDGTKIPMFITAKKGLELNGNNPTLLYGYGGFNISILPQFKPDVLFLLENGGIFAQANIRGGGEYGETWHKAGTKLQKQNVFDDFIAAAEYLIDNKYTSSQKLAVNGRSNGGLLIGACMTQRPDLFKVALPAVGVMDMLRFHKFTIGWAWTDDYGSSDNEDEFKALHKYSPLHNIKEGVSYPATLVTTADHDDRVVPAHSFKFISTLQEKHQGDNPVLIRIDVKAGHGAGKPITKIMDEQADIWAFTFYNWGITPKFE